MKPIAIVLALALTGCANTPLLSSLGVGGFGGQAYIVCRLNGKAELMQGVAGLATSQPLEDADSLCAALKH